MDQEPATIRELVIALEKYPHINENATLDEAIASCKEIQADGSEKVRQKVLLVVNDADQLVGKLSIVDIMKGLAPHLLSETKVEKFDGKTADFTDLAFLLEESTFLECGKNRNRIVKPLLHPIDLVLTPDTHLLNALVLMSKHKESIVPVKENGTVLGVLRCEEIFLAMCNTYCKLPGVE
ncbi:CBS domain-containing protein [Desulfogranum japonicum]|uniref:CBS domain-containing protein n=1 Tax=Desulfogranum japonicum TaxID=231447 RepID=UPI00041CB60F|nr:CBS domain-containing protein [Desulfogranum japonicum]